jgi:two-component system phosphate regulon sensor histidine kinase PhoR
MDDKVIKKYLKRADKGGATNLYRKRFRYDKQVGDLDLDISEFDIVELIENVFELLEMKAEKKKITLSFENYHLLPNYVRGDKDRIQQIIENLIVNSIKYGKIGGETEVAVVNLTKGANPH